MDKELEKEFANGTRNFFDIDREFFLIDSDNLDSTDTRMYGYSVQMNGIYENKNLSEEAIKGLTGCGAYVLVTVSDQNIRVTQDYNGSYGLYFFQSGSYFALSNSFWKLLDSITSKAELNINRDYCNHILTDGLATLGYSDTPVEEIKLLDKDAVILIDKQRKTISFDTILYKDNQLSLESKEGIAALDEWFTRWTTVFRNIKAKATNMTVYLSGGFDSRITFLLMLKSGMNLNEISVRSFNNDLKTHAEDFKIATKISEYFKFKLNQPLPATKRINFSLEDAINICFYNKLPFHKEMYFKYGRSVNKIFTVPGAGGESVRAHWDVTASQFIEQACNRTKRYSKSLKHETKQSIAKVLRKAYDKIYEKHGIENRESIEYPLQVHRDVRCRAHFGKAVVDDYFSNCITLTPLIDPDLRRIKLSIAECQDNNLLMAMIYIRYCPELLLFEFEGNRKIDAKTIAAAKRINDRYPPYKFDKQEVNKDFALIVNDDETERKLELGNNKNITTGEPDNYFERAFSTTTLRRLFKTEFSSEFLEIAQKQAKDNRYFPLRDIYPIVMLAGVIDKVIASRSKRQPMELMKRFVNSEKDTSYNKIEPLDRYRNYFTARVDVKLSGENADINLLDYSDEFAHVTQPAWQQRGGKGYVIESTAGSMRVQFMANTTGKMSIHLRSRDVKDTNKSRIAYWIDFVNLKINGRNLITQRTPVWHDSPYVYAIEVGSGDIIDIVLEWEPHRDPKLGYNSDIKELIQNQTIVEKEKSIVETLKDKILRLFSK